VVEVYSQASDGKEALCGRQCNALVVILLFLVDFNIFYVFYIIYVNI